MKIIRRLEDISRVREGRGGRASEVASEKSFEKTASKIVFIDERTAFFGVALGNVSTRVTREDYDVFGPDRPGATCRPTSISPSRVGTDDFSPSALYGRGMSRRRSRPISGKRALFSRRPSFYLYFRLDPLPDQPSFATFYHSPRNQTRRNQYFLDVCRVIPISRRFSADAPYFKLDSVASTVTNETSYNCQR